MILTVAAAVVNYNDTSALKVYARKAAYQLLTYYAVNPGSDTYGAVMPNTASDASGIQWWESGVYWESVLGYSRTFSDKAYDSYATVGLGSASFGEYASFLGPWGDFAAILAGKWNDDIMWWGLASVTGVEIYGTSMPGNFNPLPATVNTWNQVMRETSDACGGGFYWSRDRSNPNTKGYKSTITNVQHMMLGARLYILTGNDTYLNAAKSMSDWLHKTIISGDGSVYDGVDEDQNCNLATGLYSYNPGILIGAYAWLYKGTQDLHWITLAQPVLERALSTYASTGVILELCEPQCKLNQIKFKALLVRGLGFYGNLTPNPAEKAKIKSILATSMDAMLKTCDDNGNCGDDWTGATQKPNFHTQITAMELLNAYMLVSDNVSIKSQAVQTTNTTQTNSATKASVFALCLLLLL